MVNFCPLYKHIENSAVCLLLKHKNKSLLFTYKKDQEKSLPVERDKVCFVARVTFKVCKCSTYVC